MSEHEIDRIERQSERATTKATRGKQPQGDDTRAWKHSRRDHGGRVKGEDEGEGMGAR